jgi:hypothetical protein
MNQQIRLSRTVIVSLEFPEFLKQKMLLYCNFAMLKIEASGIYIF